MRNAGIFSNCRVTRHTPAIGLVLAFLALASVAARAARADATTAPAADAATDEALDALDQRGKTLKTFSADVRMALIDPALGTGSTYTGTIFFQQRGPGDASIRADFDRREEDGKIFTDRREYVYADGQLLDRNYHSKTQVTRQIARPGQKINLLKLGEGPFPLPIGQPRQDVYANFTVQHIPPAAGDPAGTTTHIQLTPKPGTSLARRFKTIDVWVDHADDMPVRIETLDKNESEDRRTDFTDVKINAPVRAADFAPAKLDTKDWNVTDEPYQD